MRRISAAATRRANIQALRAYERFGTRLFMRTLRQQAEDFDSVLLQSAYIQYYERVFVDAARREFDRIRTMNRKEFIPDGFFLETWRAWIGQWVVNNLGGLIQDVNDNTLLKIRTALAFAQEEGLNPFQTQKYLKDIVGSPARALAIARTEATRANSMGKLRSAEDWERETGTDLWKLWVHGGSREARPEHLALASNPPIRKHERFPIGGGMDAPGDIAGGAAQTINCFTEDQISKINISSINKIYESVYHGHLYKIKMSSGNDFTCTPNHPILTKSGWIPAKFLNKSHQIINADSIQPALGNFNINNVPLSFRQILDSFPVNGVSDRISRFDVDFHGDRPDSDVNIINIKGLLPCWAEPLRNKPIIKNILKNTYFRTGFFLCFSLLNRGFMMKIFRKSSHYLISIFSYFSSFFNSLIFKPLNIGFASASNFNSFFNKDSSDYVSGCVVFNRNRKFRLTRSVVKNNIFDINIPIFRMLNFIKIGIFGKKISKGVIVNADNISNLINQKAIIPKFDYLVSKEVIHNFKGNVYTFETDKQMYEINGIIARNCSCTVVYVSEEYVRRYYPELV